MDIGCLSHTLDLVGTKFNFPTGKLFSRTAASQSYFGGKCIIITFVESLCPNIMLLCSSRKGEHCQSLMPGATTMQFRWNFYEYSEGNSACYFRVQSEREQTFKSRLFLSIQG